MTTALTLDLIDPCVEDVTITIGDLSAWPATTFVTDPTTFAIDPATQLSHVTTPAGADCGAYTVEFAVVDGADTPADAAFLTNNAYDLVVDFDHDTAQAKEWFVEVRAYFTNYPD